MTQNIIRYYDFHYIYRNTQMKTAYRKETIVSGGKLGFLFDVKNRRKKGDSHPHLLVFRMELSSSTRPTFSFSRASTRPLFKIAVWNLTLVFKACNILSTALGIAQITPVVDRVATCKLGWKTRSLFAFLSDAIENNARRLGIRR